MHFQTSFICMQMISAFLKTKSNQNKHCSFFQGNHAGQLPGLGRGPTPLAEVLPRWPHSPDWSREKSGFPFLEEHDKHEEHEHKGDECKDRDLLLLNLRFHAMGSKTWTCLPIFKDLVRTNTKTRSLMQTFRLNKTFLSRTHEHHFLFLKPTLNRCMTCKTGSIMQCS